MNKRVWIIAAVLGLIILGIVIFIGQNKTAFNKNIFSSSVNLAAQAKELKEKGSLIEAKNIYKKLINDFPGSNEVMNWQREAEDLNIKLLFSSTITPKSMFYEVKPGETLVKIAKQFHTTAELIKKSNNLKDDKIFPGQKIKIWTAPFSIVVDKSQNILILKSDDEIIKTYIVSTGVNNSTPVGVFKIVNKLSNPTWFKAGTVVASGSPDNILGSRWLGFDLAGYGIHGTTAPQSLGHQATQGCVRMANNEVEELYIIVPVGTEATIVD